MYRSPIPAHGVQEAVRWDTVEPNRGASERLIDALRAALLVALQQSDAQMPDTWAAYTQAQADGTNLMTVGFGNTDPDRDDDPKFRVQYNFFAGAVLGARFFNGIEGMRGAYYRSAAAGEHFNRQVLLGDVSERFLALAKKTIALKATEPGLSVKQRRALEANPTGCLRSSYRQAKLWRVQKGRGSALFQPVGDPSYIDAAHRHDFRWVFRARQGQDRLKTRLADGLRQAGVSEGHVQGHVNNLFRMKTNNQLSWLAKAGTLSYPSERIDVKTAFVGYRTNLWYPQEKEPRVRGAVIHTFGYT